MSLASIITACGSVVAALTPNPATPTFSESDYRRPLEESAKGDVERLFSIGVLDMAMDNGPGRTTGNLLVTHAVGMFLDLGYQKKRYEGGGGTTGLDGRAATDCEQIMHALATKSNWHSSVLQQRDFSVSQIADNEQMRIYRIQFSVDYRLTL
jgi:hypothetical protein